MKREQVRHLSVLGPDGTLVGIVTDRDLRQVVFDPSIQELLGGAVDALKDLTVRDVMTWTVVTARPDMSIREAASVMRERKIGALPVVERGRVVGMLTERDVLRAFEAVLRGHVERVSPIPANEADARRAPGDPWRSSIHAQPFEIAPRSSTGSRDRDRSGRSGDSGTAFPRGTP